MIYKAIIVNEAREVWLIVGKDQENMSDQGASKEMNEVGMQALSTLGQYHSIYGYDGPGV